MSPQPAFDRRGRDALVADYHAALRAGDTDRIVALGRVYVDRLPVVPLSRCPLTGEVLSHSIDHFDLDGPWWDYDRPWRPLEHLPRTFFALAGAVRLGEPVARAPFVCRPGPAVPFVVPRMLDRPEVVAVVSSLPVGPHTGYALAYFADPMPGGVKRINAWGAADYPVRRPDGSLGWNAALDWSPEWDFDLRSWIERGKLAWISPGDATLALRREAGGCPYLDLDGSHEPASIYDGRAVYPPPPPEEARAFRPNE